MLQGFGLQHTELACMCFASRILPGITFAYNSSYWYSAVGLSVQTNYTLTLGGTALGLVGTFVNWTAMIAGHESDRGICDRMQIADRQL